MHPLNKYKDQINYENLIKEYPSLLHYLKKINDQTYILDETIPNGIKELTKAMLIVDFNIKSYIGVPDGYLIPSVTRSLNYIHFTQDLLSELSSNNNNNNINCLDIGCGASCVLSLLGLVLNPNWQFVSLDIDDLAIEYSKLNTKQFETRIQINKSDFLSYFKLNPNVNNKFDLLLCNPPFFKTPFDSNEFHSEFYGTVKERCYEPNGEVGFVLELIKQIEHDKLIQVNWFTTMLGLKQSINPIIEYLNQIPVETIRIYRLEQGQTFRWVLAYSNSIQNSLKTINGNELTIDNLNQQETIQDRIHQALSLLNHFSINTGICALNKTYRFRIFVKVIDFNKFKVRIFDIKGEEKHAYTVLRKIEQDMLQINRKWKKFKKLKHEDI
jgi:23S rRNA A1618 N6-methylase RlmF